MSPKCTIDDRFFGKSGDRRIRCTRQPEKRKRNAFPQAPRFVKRAPPETKETPAAKTASRAGSQSHQCCRLAPPVCLRERWAFSRRTLLLHAPIQVEQALPKQPLGRAEGNSARKALRAGSQSHLCCRLAEQVCLKECSAFSRRTLLLHAPIQVEQALPKQPLGQAEGNTVRKASRAGSQSLSAADFLCKSAYENAGRSRAGLCSCTSRYKLNKPCQNSPSDKPRETR